MNELLPTAADDVPPRRAWALALLIAIIFFAAVAPTLNWLQFASGNENLVAEAALEMRQGGPKLLPNMMGEPRVKKPPLVTWITAAAMRPQTVAELHDPKEREDAYRDLAFQVRWPALLAAAVMTLAAFETGRVWAGEMTGLMTALVVCTNYLFLKYMRQATTDVHLAAWVAVANACFAHGVLRGRWWLAATVGALATGIAFLCKGPVALVESVLPMGVMAAVMCWRGKENLDGEGSTTAEPLSLPPPARGGEENLRRIVQIGVGIVLFAAVALPWFIYVLRTVPNVGHVWTQEVGREGATALDVSNPIVYAELPFLTVPWIVFAVVGLLALWQKRRVRAAWWPIVFSVVPLLVMVWFRDRKERYMLPMIVPAAMICGYGLATWIRSWQAKPTVPDRIIGWIHFILILAIGSALLIAGMNQKRLDGTPWFGPRLAVWLGVALFATLGLTLLWQRRRAWAMPVATFGLMLAYLAAYQFGYRDTEQGRSSLKPLADAILAQAPDAAVYDWVPRGRVDEQMGIYLARPVLKADPATLKPIDRPLVLITRLSKRDEPTILSNDWQPLAVVYEGTVKWSAFIWRP